MHFRFEILLDHSNFCKDREGGKGREEKGLFLAHQPVHNSHAVQMVESRYQLPDEGSGCCLWQPLLLEVISHVR